MSDAFLVLALAFALDLVAGDPPNALHPVAWLGRLAGALRARMPTEPRGRAFASGILLVVVVLSVAGLAGSALELGLEGAPRVVRLVVSALFLGSCFALRGLLEAATTLVEVHERDGLEAARGRLSWLCSRDASELGADELAGGTIESVAENLSDSVVAPLFYFLLFGLPGAAIYRAANTLDAMVGYRGRYEWLGKPAARLDDLLNLIPARITAVCLLLAGALGGLDARRGVRIHARDHALTESPNAGHPMAMAAGLLGLRLDKPGAYALGAELPSPRLDDVARATTLVRRAAFVFVAAALLGVLLGV